MEPEAPSVTYCPDCERDVEGDFVQHREAEHPPATISVAIEGIESQEAHGYQPDDKE